MIPRSSRNAVCEILLLTISVIHFILFTYQNQGDRTSHISPLLKFGTHFACFTSMSRINSVFPSPLFYYLTYISVIVEYSGTNTAVERRPCNVDRRKKLFFFFSVEPIKSLIIIKTHFKKIFLLYNI